MTSENIAGLSVYKDNGDGLFNPSADLLSGTQTAVNVGSNTTVTTAANNGISTSTTKGIFFVSIRTAASWSSTSTPDTIQVVFPSDGIVTSASSPTVSSTATADIIADTVAPTLLSVVAYDTGSTADKTSGDSIVFTFSEPTNKSAITSANATSTFTVNNEHSLLDGNGDLGLAVWNAGGTTLTLTFTGTSTVPTVELGDTIAIGGSAILDQGGNAAVGSASVTGTFGAAVKLNPTVATQVQNASNVDLTNTAILFGTAIHDYVTVSGSSATPTGTVTFTLHGNSACSGSVLATEQATIVNGSAASTATTTLAIGNYGYNVSYAGNDLYNASTGVCEPFSIVASPIQKATPSIATQIRNASDTNISGQTVAIGTVIRGYAMVSGNVGTPTGTVDFMRFANGTCAGDPATVQNNVALSAGAAAGAAFTTAAAGTLSYRVNYDGNDSYNSGTGSCQMITVQETTPTQVTSCSNGLINGRLYMVLGKSRVFLAAACRLKEFKGNAVGHAKGNKFQDIIPLPAESIDENGQLVKTFVITLLNTKPAKVKNVENENNDSEHGNGKHNDNDGDEDDD